MKICVLRVIIVYALLVAPIVCESRVCGKVRPSMTYGAIGSSSQYLSHLTVQLFVIAFNPFTFILRLTIIGGIEAQALEQGPPPIVPGQRWYQRRREDRYAPEPLYP